MLALKFALLQRTEDALKLLANKAFLSKLLVAWRQLTTNQLLANQRLLDEQNRNHHLKVYEAKMQKTASAFLVNGKRIDQLRANFLAWKDYVFQSKEDKLKDAFRDKQLQQKLHFLMNNSAKSCFRAWSFQAQQSRFEREARARARRLADNKDAQVDRVFVLFAARNEKKSARELLAACLKNWRIIVETNREEEERARRAAELRLIAERVEQQKMRVIFWKHDSNRFAEAFFLSQ